MQMIEAIIRPSRLDAVKAQLAKYGILGVTAIECRSIGVEELVGQRYRGIEMKVDVVPRVMLKVCVRDYEAQPAVEAIRHGARTANEGDGEIYVFSVSEAVRIRTGETNEQALV